MAVEMSVYKKGRMLGSADIGSTGRGELSLPKGDMTVGVLVTNGDSQEIYVGYYDHKPLVMEPKGTYTHIAILTGTGTNVLPLPKKQFVVISNS